MLCSVFSVQTAMIVSFAKSSSLRLVVDVVLVHGGAKLMDDGSFGADGLARGAACCGCWLLLFQAVAHGLAAVGGFT